MRTSEHKNCDTCGATFFRTSNRTDERWAAARFCSIACNAEAQRGFHSDPVERFWKRVKRRGDVDCWEWDTARPDGYGGLRVDGSAVLVHRFAYELLVAPIPEGFEIDHLCRNRLCANPAHLQAVDHRTNVLRGIAVTAANALKTVCIRGHEFTPENTYEQPSRPGTRRCKRCERDRRVERERLARQARAA